MGDRESPSEPLFTNAPCASTHIPPEIRSTQRAESLSLVLYTRPAKTRPAVQTDLNRAAVVVRSAKTRQGCEPSDVQLPAVLQGRRIYRRPAGSAAPPRDLRPERRGNLRLLQVLRAVGRLVELQPPQRARRSRRLAAKTQIAGEIFRLVRVGKVRSGSRLPQRCLAAETQIRGEIVHLGSGELDQASTRCREATTARVNPARHTIPVSVSPSLTPRVAASRQDRARRHHRIPLGQGGGTVGRHYGARICGRDGPK